MASKINAQITAATTVDVRSGRVESFFWRMVFITKRTIDGMKGAKRGRRIGVRMKRTIKAPVSIAIERAETSERE